MKHYILERQGNKIEIVQAINKPKGCRSEELTDRLFAHYDLRTNMLIGMTTLDSHEEFYTS